MDEVDESDGWVDLEFPPRVTCPTCGKQVPFGIQAKIDDGVVALRAVLADVWAHSFTHDG